MSEQPDERELFRRLGDDAHRARLAGPGELRRRSDRRTAARAALGTVAVVVAVGGVLVGTSALNGTAAPEIADTPSPSPSATPSEDLPSPQPSPTETTTQVAASAIPEEAWLDESDLRLGVSHRGAFEPPRLCGDPLVSEQLVDSGAAIVDGTRDGNYQAPGTPEFNTPDGTTRQTIVLLRDVRAADDLMDAVEATVAACPEESTIDEPSWVSYTLADPALPATSSAAPDRHVLIDVSTSYEMYWEIAPESGPDRFDTFISVLQVGDAVSFLEVRGWESSDTGLDEVRPLAARVALRLLNWRNS